MPFRSVRQRRFMWARHPAIARRWTRTYGSKPRPKRGGRRRRTRSRRRRRR